MTISEIIESKPHPYTYAGLNNNTRYQKQDVAVAGAKHIHPVAIEMAVCIYFEMTPETLFSKTRRREIVYPRQMLIYLMLELTGWANYKIAKRLKADPTTTSHAKKTIQDLIDTEPDKKADYENIKNNLK